MEIFIKSFASVELDGVSAGDAFSVYSNYPEISADLLAALIRYDEGRQQGDPPPDLSLVSEALIQGSFDEWLLESWSVSDVALRGAMDLIAALKVGDVEAVRSAYHVITQANPPSQERLEEWQGILDSLGVPKELIAFL